MPGALFAKLSTHTSSEAAPLGNFASYRRYSFRAKFHNSHIILSEGFRHTLLYRRKMTIEFEHVHPISASPVLNTPESFRPAHTICTFIARFRAPVTNWAKYYVWIVKEKGEFSFTFTEMGTWETDFAKNCTKHNGNHLAYGYYTSRKISHAKLTPRSTFIQMYSPVAAVTPMQTQLTIHQFRFLGIPTNNKLQKRWIKCIVAAKSRHCFARPTMQPRRPPLQKWQRHGR